MNIKLRFVRIQNLYKEYSLFLSIFVAKIFRKANKVTLSNHDNRI